MALNIKKAIKAHGLEVREVAARMGITPTGLSQHINGNPSVEVLSRIASAIGCDISELFEAPKSGVITCPHCGKSITIKAEIPKTLPFSIKKPYKGETIILRTDDGTQYKYKKPKTKTEQLAILEILTEPDSNGLVSVRNVNLLDSDSSEVFDEEFDRLIPMS